MVEQRVGRERLLEAREVECVEPFEMIGVGRCVASVGVDLERDVGPDLGAYGGDDVDIVTACDLELHAAVALGRVAGDLGEERAEILLHADRDSGVDVRGGTAEVGRECDPVGAELRVEHVHP